MGLWAIFVSWAYWVPQVRFTSMSQLLVLPKSPHLSRQLVEGFSDLFRPFSLLLPIPWGLLGMPGLLLPTSWCYIFGNQSNTRYIAWLSAIMLPYNFSQTLAKAWAKVGIDTTLSRPFWFSRSWCRRWGFARLIDRAISTQSNKQSQRNLYTFLKTMS